MDTRNEINEIFQNYEVNIEKFSDNKDKLALQRERHRNK